MSAIFAMLTQHPAVDLDATNQSILDQTKTIANEMVQLTSKVSAIAIKTIDMMGIYAFRLAAIGSLIGLFAGKVFELAYIGVISGMVLGLLIRFDILDTQ